MPALSYPNTGAMLIARQAAAQKQKHIRSRVTNGTTPFVEADQRSPWARRFKDILAGIVSDLGGVEVISVAQVQLARRAATIAVICERMEGEAAGGKPFDLEAFGKLTDRLGRAFTRLGVKRQARDVGVLSLADLRSPDLRGPR
jgi:hypothetical protein